MIRFRYWCQDYEEKLSEIIANLLISKYPNSSPNKRKRPSKNNAVPSTSPTSEQVSCALRIVLGRNFPKPDEMFSNFSCWATWSTLGGVVDTETVQGPVYTYRTQCNEPSSRRSRIVMTIQKWVILIILKYHSI